MTRPEFPEDSWVQVRYPLNAEQERGDRAAWPWLPELRPSPEPEPEPGPEAGT